MEFDSWRLEFDNKNHKKPAIFSLDYLSLKYGKRFEYLNENISKQGRIFIHSKVQ